VGRVKVCGFKLRVESVGVDCDLHEALLMSNLRDGDRLVLFAGGRWMSACRLPREKNSRPTPSKCSTDSGAELVGRVATKKDASGRVLAAFAEG